MALDVVAFLERAMDDAKATNFAGLCCLVTESAIAGAPRALRKGHDIKMPEELGVVFREVPRTALHPRRCSSGREVAHVFYMSIFGGVEHLRAEVRNRLVFEAASAYRDFIEDAVTDPRAGAVFS